MITMLVLMTGCYNTPKPAEPVCGSQEMGESLNDLEARAETAYFMCTTSRSPEQAGECTARYEALRAVVGKVDCPGLPAAIDQANAMLNEALPGLVHRCQRAENCVAFAEASPAHIQLPPID